MHSYICTVASHLGMLHAPREGRDAGVKPEDGVCGPILKMEGPLEYMSEQEMLTKQASSNKHGPSVEFQASPEHSKSPSILQNNT